MRKAGRRMLAGVGAVALLASAGAAALPGAGDRLVQDTLAAQTDRVQVDADFQTSRPLDVTGQWAWTSVQRTPQNSAQVLQSPYSTQPQDRQEANYSAAATTAATTACVYGGGDGASCQTNGDRASARTSGRSQVIDWDPPGLLAGLLRPNIRVETASNITTGARCWVDGQGRPQVEGLRPTGALLASSADVSSTRTFDVGAINQGTTLSQSFTAQTRILLTLSSSSAEVQITPRWGQDRLNHTAFSEVRVRYRGTSAGLLGLAPAETSWVDYTVRSECGLTANDGSGVTGPSGVAPRTATAPRRQAFAQPVPETPTPAQEPSIAVNDAALIFEYEVAVPEAAYPYRVRAERELSATDLELVKDALADVARTPDDRTGAVDGLRWEIRSADGLARILPELLLELADGTVVTAEPQLAAASPADTSTPGPTPTTGGTETVTPEPVES